MTQLREIPEPPALPSPPLLHSFFLESPGGWIVSLLLVIVAAVLISRPGRRLKIAGAGTLAAALGIGLLQHFVETGREQIMARSQEIVLAAARADAATMNRLLSPQFRGVYDRQPQGISKAETIEECRRQFEGRAAAVSFHQIRAAVDNQRFGRSQVHLTVSGDQTYGFPTISWWALSWEADAEGNWLISAAEMTYPTFNQR